MRDAEAVERHYEAGAKSFDIRFLACPTEEESECPLICREQTKFAEFLRREKLFRNAFFTSF